MAATTLAEGGDRGSSRQLWQQLYESADNDWVKNNAQLRLAQMDALDQMDVLAALVRRYVDANGKAPGSWRDLAPYRLAGRSAGPVGDAIRAQRHGPRRSRLAPVVSLRSRRRWTGKAANKTRTP